MAKLRFDPVTYQFYYRCPPADSGPAKAAGFRWDSARRRYYTVESKKAAGFTRYGDNYVKLLLADALETQVPHEHSQIDVRYWVTAPSFQNIVPKVAL